MKIKRAIHVTNWPPKQTLSRFTKPLCYAKLDHHFNFWGWRITGSTRRAQINIVIKCSCCLVLPLMIWLSFPEWRFISYNNDPMCSWASFSGPLDAIWLITGFLSVNYFSSLFALSTYSIFLIRSPVQTLEWIKTTGVYILICFRYVAIKGFLAHCSIIFGPMIHFIVQICGETYGRGLEHPLSADVP